MHVAFCIYSYCCILAYILHFAVISRMKQIVLESTMIAGQVVAKGASMLSDCVTSLAFDPYEELLWSGSRSVSFVKLNELLFADFNFFNSFWFALFRFIFNTLSIFLVFVSDFALSKYH